MPIAYSKIERQAVQEILRAKGYGFNSSRTYAMQLNLPSKDRIRTDGIPYREIIGRGLTSADLDRILTTSETAEEAAERVEAYVMGREQAFERKTPAAVSGESVTELIDNRVKSALAPLAEQVATLAGALTSMKDLLAELVQAKAEAKSPKKGGPAIVE